MKRWMFAVALVATSASLARAHDTWIMCTPPAIRSGASVSLHATSGMNFPDYETAPDASRIEKCEWRIGGRRGALDQFKKSESSLAVSGRVTTDGVAVIYMEFRPKEIDLTRDEVEEYMDEVGAPESVRKAWTDAGPDAAWHETYRKHAKTFLRVGESGDATGCLGPVGFNIDFLPDRDPTGLKVGDTLTIKVIRGGDEMEGFSVGAVRGGNADMQRTNQNGMVTWSIDTAGWWLVRGTELRRNVDGTWESDFTTLTFFVAAE